MLTGILVGCILGVVIGLFTYMAHDSYYFLKWYNIVLIILATILIVVFICGFIGCITDILYYKEYITTWNITKTTYEQAMQVYGDYDSIVKDNPELLKEVVEKNTQLAKHQYEATCWWNWHIDDNIANLTPIQFGTN